MAATIGIKIDHALNETERVLSLTSLYPVIGTIAGLSKVLIGVAQTIVGIVGGIFTLYARYNGNTELNNYFWTHAMHGLGNIVAGIFEAIPFVGMGVWFVRMTELNTSRKCEIRTSHEDKFIPYESLCARDIEITKDLVATQLFNGFVAQSHPSTLSLEEKYALAKQAIQQADYPIGG